MDNMCGGCFKIIEADEANVIENEDGEREWHADCLEDAQTEAAIERYQSNREYNTPRYDY